MAVKTFFIPISRDEALFLDRINASNTINYKPFHQKYPFYTLYSISGDGHLRKRRDDDFTTPYTKLSSDDVASLLLIPDEALITYLMSL